MCFTFFPFFFIKAFLRRRMCGSDTRVSKGGRGQQISEYIHMLCSRGRGGLRYCWTCSKNIKGKIGEASQTNAYHLPKFFR